MISSYIREKLRRNSKPTREYPQNNVRRYPRNLAVHMNTLCLSLFSNSGTCQPFHPNLVKGPEK